LILELKCCRFCFEVQARKTHSIKNIGGGGDSNVTGITALVHKALPFMVNQYTHFELSSLDCE